MKKNIGGIDRILRIIIGIVVLGLGYYYQNWLGLVGLIPLLTGIFEICPLYLILKLSSCKLKK